MQNVSLNYFNAPAYNAINSKAMLRYTYKDFLSLQNGDAVNFSRYGVGGEIEELFKEVQSKQGIIGKSWDFIKNKLNLKNSSNRVKDAIKRCKKGEITEAEAKKVLDHYVKGQSKIVDFCADVTSLGAGALAFGIGMGMAGVTFPLALGIAAIAGGISKCGVKFIDAKSGDRKYKTFAYDMVTGGINGFLSPIVNGIGRCVTNKTAAKLGLKTLTNGGKIPIHTKDLDELIKYFATFPKQKLNGGVISKGAAYATGKGVRSLSKLGLAFALREGAFCLLSTDRMYKNLIDKTIKFNPWGELGGMGTIVPLPGGMQHFGKGKEIDLSNDIYNVEKEDKAKAESK